MIEQRINNKERQIMAHTVSHSFWADKSKTKPKQQKLGHANENNNHADFITLILVGIIMIFTWTLMMVSQRDMENRLEAKIDKLVAQKEVVKEVPKSQTLEATYCSTTPMILTEEDMTRLNLIIDKN